MALKCPGYRVVNVIIGASATAADPMTALLQALAKFGVEVAKAIPECEGDCERTVGDTEWRNPSFNLRQLQNGNWICTLGGRLKVEVACTKPKAKGKAKGKAKKKIGAKKVVKKVAKRAKR